ncbi:putative transporter [Nostocoides japonicum T1-X7]|uniref:Putative transporter n=1 Tax=Nostocoides japonicum T1-X7 TaxID=1194083 RepID=A0A077LZC4_9MICO|nr:MFS transporter [Tetrasphaera japonica]CCH78232.1 putative transporter [Tetrasphaera japonica T1-X7]
MTKTTRTSSPGETFTFRSIAVPAYGPTVVAALGTGATAPVIALAAIDLGASVSVASFAVGLGLVAEVFFAIPAGSLIARVGERRALIWGCAVDAVFSSVAWLVPSLAGYLLAQFALGFTASVFMVARQGYLVEAVPYAVRARAMSTLGGVNRIGLFLGPFIAAPVIHLWGPRTAYAIAVVSGLGAGAIVLLSRDITAEHDLALRTAPARQPTRTVLWAHRRTFATVGIGVLFIGAVRAARTTLIPLWALHVGLTASQTALVFGVAAGLEMLVFYPAGSVMDRLGRRWVAIPCMTLMGVAFLVLPHTATLAGVGAAAIVGSVGNGLGSGIVMTLGADHAPSEGRAQFLGGWRFLSVVGGSSAPLGIGVVAGAASLALACTLVGVTAFVGALWLMCWLPRRAAPNDPVSQTSHERLGP